MRKRIFLITMIALALGGIISAQGSSEQTLKVALANHPYGILLEKKIPEFEAETGIEVEIVKMNEAELSRELQAEFEMKMSSTDVFMTRSLQEGRLFAAMGWYLPLEDYDYSDYPQNACNGICYAGIPLIVPIVQEWEVLYYRKDILAEAGIRVPETLMELEEAAAILNELDPDISGIAMRGEGNAAVTQFSSFLYNFGGRFIQDGKAVFDSMEALAAFRFYGRLLYNYGPRGITSMSWEEIIPLFQAGKIAMWADTSTFYEMVINSDVLDPEDVGIAKFPAGTQNDSPYFVTSWGLAISSFSKNQENAKKFLEWATSAEMAKIAMLNNIPVARSSVWQDEEVLAGINPELIETQAHAAANGIPEDRPNMISVQEARRLIGTVITKSIQSGGLNTDAARLAAEMAQDVNNLLEADFETYGQY